MMGVCCGVFMPSLSRQTRRLATSNYSLPSTTRACVWGTAVAHVMYKMVEGVSRVKQCSSLGRGAMTLDVKELSSRISRVITVRCVGVCVRACPLCV
jgi:hypothetical protein